MCYCMGIATNIDIINYSYYFIVFFLLIIFNFSLLFFSGLLMFLDAFQERGLSHADYRWGDIDECKHCYLAHLCINQQRHSARRSENPQVANIGINAF